MKRGFAGSNAIDSESQSAITRRQMNSAFIEMRIDCKIECRRELDLQFASAQIPFQMRLPEFQSHKMRPDQI
jgi:hypothetical protein